MQELYRSQTEQITYEKQQKERGFDMKNKLYTWQCNFYIKQFVQIQYLWDVHSKASMNTRTLDTDEYSKI